MDTWAIVVIVLLIATCVVIFKYPYIVDRYLRVNSEFHDRLLVDKLADLYATTPSKPDVLMVGSSTIARFPMDLLPTNCTNLGMDWISTHHVLKNVGVISEVMAQTIILYVGVNDMTLRTPAQCIAINIRNIVDALPESVVRVLYIPIIKSRYQKSLGPMRSAHIDNINSRVHDAISHDPRVLFIEHNGLFGLKDFQLDGLHLSRKGYGKLSERIRAELASPP